MMEQVYRTIIGFSVSFFVADLYVHVNSTRVTSLYVRELFYNETSAAFTSSILMKTKQEKIHQCFLQCSETSTCISLLYRSDSTECMLFSAFLEDQPLTPTTLADMYFVEEAAPCSKIGYTFERRVPFCYKIHDELVSSEEAFRTCSAEGGRLIQIDSPIKQDVVETFDLTGTSRNPRIDGFRVNGRWEFSSGSLISKFYWKPGNPANGYCLSLSLACNNSWEDVSCSYDRGFICERLL